MHTTAVRPKDRIALAAPILWMVLAATAVPIELRPLGRGPLDWGMGISDVIENVVGFVPVGMALAGFGLWRAVLLATAMSVLAETSQLWMMHRTSQLTDVASNLTGGAIGAFVSVRYGIRMPALPAGRVTGLGAATVAILLAAGISLTTGDALNPRGTTEPGTLEAEWRFDEAGGTNTPDSSGHNLTGKLHGRPQRVPGRMGGAILFRNPHEYVELRHAPPLRLTGSMTITAWINSTSFPPDDAAIVSQLNSNAGYQLDTTIDKGPRTISFKLSNSCGELMARYGTTPLSIGTWYHVAGVYDARAKTLDVYLNGKLDNGYLLGPVTSSQTSSRSKVFIGRRDTWDFEFSGAVDDVRIYSAALTGAEIAEVMEGKRLGSLSLASQLREPGVHEGECLIYSDSADGRIPGAVASLGVLLAIASVCLWRKGGPFLGLAISLMAGLFPFATRADSLPPFNLWMMPLISFVGGVSVAISIRSPAREPQLQSVSFFGSGPGSGQRVE